MTKSEANSSYSCFGKQTLTGGRQYHTPGNHKKFDINFDLPEVERYEAVF